MSIKSSPSQAKTTGSRVSPKVIGILIGIALLLIAVFALYWAGLSHGHAQMAQQKTEDASRLKASQIQTADALAQVAALQEQNRLMTARGLLYQAAIALDRRNFGVASNDVEKAGQALAAAQPAIRADAAQFNGVRQAVAGTKITVAQDLDDQRSRLLNLAAQLDALTH